MRKKNLLQDTVSLALAVCEKYISESETAVDCTCGRGADTLFLAERCGKVYSFDIQDEAIGSAEELLTSRGISWEVIDVIEEHPEASGKAFATAERAGLSATSDEKERTAAMTGLPATAGLPAAERLPATPRVSFIKDSHVNMRRYVKDEVGVMVFNLGYLPKGDKGITTLPETTAEAVRLALDMIRTGGLVCVTVYPGHENGRKERELLKRFAGRLEKSRFHCVYAEMLNQSDTAPEILWITKKK